MPGTIPITPSLCQPWRSWLLLWAFRYCSCLKMFLLNRKKVNMQKKAKLRFQEGTYYLSLPVASRTIVEISKSDLPVQSNPDVIDLGEIPISCELAQSGQLWVSLFNGQERTSYIR